VGYSYSIGTYDVTVSQYVAFLNSNDPTGANSLGLYNSDMSDTGPNIAGGIDFTPSNANGAKYTIIAGTANHPVNYVNWFDTIRFANWMNNGEVPGSTETGAYTLFGGTPIPSNAASIARNPGASVFLPNINEWYKAAFYDPATKSYFQYATSSNTVPTASFPTAAPNSANYWPGGPNELTDVGAYTGTTSPSGAYDMAGDVINWLENVPMQAPTDRENIGGTFDFSSDFLIAGPFRYGDSSADNNLVGFRLASIIPVPEPSACALAALASMGLIGLAWRRCRSA
jgi:sulfatase modifying factor 1